MLWWTAALANPLCDEVMKDRPNLAVVREALESPGTLERCRWSEHTNGLRTVEGVLASIFFPVIGSVVASEIPVIRNHSAQPLAFALTGRNRALFDLLLPRSTVDVHHLAMAIDRDEQEMLDALLLHTQARGIRILGGRAAYDPGSLQALLDKGIVLDDVVGVRSSRALSPAWVELAMDRGLKPVHIDDQLIEGGPPLFELALRRVPDPFPLLELAVVIHQRWDLVQHAVEAGIDIHAPSNHVSLLNRAAEAGSVRWVRLCLAAGLDPRRTTTSGETALHAAAESGNPELLPLLEGAGLETPDVLGATALTAAMWSPDLRFARALLKRGVAIDDRTIEQAALEPYKMTFLLEQGLKPDRVTQKGKSLAWMATTYQNVEVFAELVRHGAPLDGSTPKTSAFHAAALSGDEAWMRKLVENGARLDRVPESDKVWIRLNRQPISPELSAFLVDHHLPPPSWMVARWIAGDERARLVSFLERGGQIEPSAWTVLAQVPLERAESTLRAFTPPASDLGPLVRKAVTAEPTGLLPLLLELGADPNAPFLSKTPLGLALEEGRVEHVGTLVAGGASPEGATSEGRPFLHAAFALEPSLLPVWLEAGADPNVVDPDGKTLLNRLLVKKDRDLESIDELVAHQAHVHSDYVMWVVKSCDAPRIDATLERWSPAYEPSKLAKRSGCDKDLRVRIRDAFR